jgi:hypothetical protein
MMEEILIPAIIFFATYHIIRALSDHLLKRKIIKSGHFEKAEILSQTKLETEEVNKYPSLKWGLVAFMAGAGLIVTEMIMSNNPYWMDDSNAILPIGIELVFISLGFLIYFFVVNFRKK